MQRLSWLIAPSFDSIAFALRLCLAEALALYLSMWLQLDRPYWASLEVAVMIQPMPGLAVVRGFARAAGTLVAGGAGLLIVALFQQSYELSAAALTLWITLCAFGANLLRNNLAYGFSIAGFIAGISVILSHTLPLPPFDIVVARVSECVLAAIVTAAVNVLFTVPKTARAYRASRIALLAGIGAEYVRLADLGGPASTPDESRGADRDGAPSDPHAVLEELAAQALALEQNRQYVSYEWPGFSHFNRMARRLDYEILALTSAASSLHIYLESQAVEADTTPLGALAEPARRMADDPNDWQAIKQAFDAAHDTILNQARAAARRRGGTRRVDDWVVVSRALDLASRGRAAIIKHGMLLEERVDAAEDIKRRSEFGQPIDLKNALRNAARTFTAVGLGGLVWVNFHNQLPAVLLMILLGALTSILATLPDPVAAAAGFAKGLGFGAIAAFLVDFLILPTASSYAMLMLAMLPVYFVAGLAMTQPSLALALPGRISAVMFSLLVHVQNGTLEPFTTYIQIIIGILGAVSLTALAFRLVLPVAPRKRLREQMSGVFKELAAGRRYSRERFETRMYDRLNGLVLAGSAEGPGPLSARQAVMAAINIGLEARALVVMTERIRLPDDLAQHLAAERQALRGLFAGRGPASLDEARRQARSIEAWAKDMIEHALSRDNEAERRLAVRAAICAELVASALMDYVGAFEHGEPPRNESAEALG